MLDHYGIPHDSEAFQEDFRGKIKLYKGGSSAPPATTTTISKSEPPEYVKPYSIEMMNRAGALSNKAYTPYTGSRIAGLTPEHYTGLDMTTNRALYGSPAVNSAQEMASRTFGDYYLNQGMDLASSRNPYLGKTSGQISNPYITQINQSDISAGRNAMLGMNNPYLQAAIGNAQGDVIDQYKNVVTPQLAAAQVTQGAFGNTGLQQQQSQALSDLTKNLGNISNDMRMQDYGMQQQLFEADVNRRMAADQFNAQGDYNSSLAKAQMYGDLQSQNANLRLEDLTRNSNMWNTGLQNQLMMYGAERDKQANAMEFAPALAEQDYIDAQNLLGVGDIYRNYSQQGLDYNFDQWQQAQNYPYQQLDLLANAVRTSMGGGGTNVTSAPNAYAPNSTASMIGTGLAGYGALQGILS